LGKIKIFFGPSRQFANVFKTALLFSVEQHNLTKNDATPFNFIMQKEPLFDQILANMVLGQTLSLKQKARILIPDCAVLIGVID
jgi:threonine/homoserine efflux transporter RhtA